MKAYLLFPGRDLEAERPLTVRDNELIQDLNLDVLLGAMAGDDPFILGVCRRVLLSAPVDVDEIAYRQEILGDCLRNPAAVREVYDLAVESLQTERKVGLGAFLRSPGSILYSATAVMDAFVVLLRRLRTIAETGRAFVASRGFTRLYTVLQEELGEPYLAQVRGHLKELRFRGGVLVSAGLGPGNHSVSFVLRRPMQAKAGFVQRIFSRKPPAFSFRLAERDESGARALSELRDKGLNLAANALAQSADHILSFLTMLRTELAFYLGCMNLYERLPHAAGTVCFPLPAPAGERCLSFTGLFDACLALSKADPVVDNDLNADGKTLVVVTGPNQGGKSTFLRSVGLAQVMMQAGMFVAARSFSADVCKGIHSHFKREEDATLQSGKLDEELARMSQIVDVVSPGSLLLLNESFSSTNEREGAEISRQIVDALVEAGIKVLFVTHLHSFAQDEYERRDGAAVFLRAARRESGERTFKMEEARPLETSFAQDIYRSVFEAGGSTGQ